MKDKESMLDKLKRNLSTQSREEILHAWNSGNEWDSIGMKDKGTRIVTTHRFSSTPVLIYGFERHGSNMHILFIQPVKKPAQGLRRISREELKAIRNEAYQLLIA